MQTVVIVIHLMVVLAMIGVVLLQKSEGGGLGVGSTGGVMSYPGTAQMVTRGAALLAGAVFLTSPGVSILAGLGRNPTTIIQPGGTPGQTAPSNQTPGSSGTTAPDGGGQTTQPTAPQVPKSE